MTSPPTPDPLEPARQKVEAPPPEEVFVPVVPGQRSLLRLVVRPLLRGWMRLHVEGVDHVPARGPVLVASTHQSHGDSVAIGAALRRPVHFLGDLRLTELAVVGRWLPRLGMVPLRRGEADASALEVLRRLLASGAAITVYPEGSRSRDGRVHRLRSGVARLAADSQAPVVPTAVIGIGKVWPIHGRPRLLGGTVTVRFGAVIDPPARDPRSRRLFTQQLHAALVELSGFEGDDGFSPIGGGEGDEPG